MTDALRASALAIIVTVPDEFSFHRLLERVRLVAACPDAPIASASMPWTLWNKLIASAAMVASAHAIGKMIVTFELPTSEPDMSDGIRAADAVRLGYTSAGHLVIEFLDERCAVFALAYLTAEQMSTFIGQGCDLVEIVSKGGLAMTECMGKA